MAATRDLHAARLLKELATDKGLSPEALAWEIYKTARIQVSGRTIRRIEQAGVIPTPRVQFALASFFGLRPTEIWPLPSQRKVAA